MSKSRWYETFFQGLYAHAMASEPLESRAAGEARTVRRALRLRKGMRVLDCPCGLGRITLPLAKMGLDVTGADLTGAYIRRARRRAKAAGLSVPFVRCDMRELPFAGQFDAVVNWFTSFGYFDDAGDLAAAKAFFAALKPGGRLLIELQNKSSLLRRFTPRGQEQAGGVRIVSRRRWDARASRIRDCWTLSKGRRRETHRFAIRLYSGPEIRAVLRKAGFRDVRLFGGLDLGRLTRHSRRMIAVATRPGR